MMEINWKHDVNNDDLLNFRPQFPEYHPFLSLSLLSWWWWWQSTFFHFLDKQSHLHLNQVVPRQPYVGQRQQLPERTEGVATHFHHKVTFLKMMRMATIIAVITIVILNKSLSGKWRGRILGNTLAGASKVFALQDKFCIDIMKKQQPRFFEAIKSSLNILHLLWFVLFVLDSQAGIFYNFIICYFKDL